MVRLCKCVLHHEILANVERGMTGLTKAKKLRKPSSLLKLIDRNAWITAEKDWFTAHLRNVAIRQTPRWHFRVVTDAELVTAWLATAALKGSEILDPDAAEAASRRSLRHLTLVDIADPPALLIIRLGVKAARNVAMPEVLLEALQHRAHEHKPTWVWDQPMWPLAPGHICYSAHVEEFMEDWKRVEAKSRASAHFHAPSASAETSGSVNARDLLLSNTTTKNKKGGR